ncbi:hypothetical protein AKJ16_DCAP00645 [Drosera capensis]
MDSIERASNPRDFICLDEIVLRMKSQRLRNCARNAAEVNEVATAAQQFTAGLKPGDALWVKHRATSWWPAQVADENTFSRSNKPRKRTSTSVLVRLYGTYEHLYVDAMKCLADFEDISKQHDGDARKIFQKALELVMSKSKSETEDSKESKPSGSDASGIEDRKQLGTKKMKLIKKSSSGLTKVKSGDSVARRLRVMQDLGLVAPSGSPFHKNGRILCFKSWRKDHHAGFLLGNFCIRHLVMGNAVVISPSHKHTFCLMADNHSNSRECPVHPIPGLPSIL